MTTMVAEVYDALVSAGASEDKARAAATAIAGYDQATLKADVDVFKRDLSGIKTDVSSLRSDVNSLKTDVAVLKWATGLLVAGMASLIIKAFF